MLTPTHIRSLILSNIAQSRHDAYGLDEVIIARSLLEEVSRHEQSIVCFPRFSDRLKALDPRLWYWIDLEAESVEICCQNRLAVRSFIMAMPTGVEVDLMALCQTLTIPCPDLDCPLDPDNLIDLGLMRDVLVVLLTSFKTQAGPFWVTYQAALDDKKDKSVASEYVQSTESMRIDRLEERFNKLIEILADRTSWSGYKSV